MNSVMTLALVAVTILCLALAAGCTAPGYFGAQPPPGVAQPAAPVSCPGLEANSPGNAELKQMVSSFDAYAENARQEWGVPGMAIAIVKGDGILLAKGYGVKAAGGSDPVTPETLFQIASTSKAFTSAIVAMEVDRGALEWDDKVTTYLPDFQMKDPWVTREFTVTDTMAHRSGLPGYWGDDLMVLGYNDSYAIHALRYADPVSSFRSEYAYQNVVYSVPTAIVEKTTGTSWQENLETRIFAPLGMNGSSADYESFRTATDVAVPHMYTPTMDGSLVSEPIPADSPLRSMTYLQPGAGGINSNIQDMARWLRFQMGNGTFDGQRLISEENLNYVHSPKTPITANTQEPMLYCQGWIYQETTYGPIIWHSGAVDGYHNYIGYAPREKVGIVILTNNVQSSLADVLFYQFFSLYFGNTTSDFSGETLKILKTQGAGAFAPKPEIPAAGNSSLPLFAYTGTYENTPYGFVVVSEQNGSLTMMMGPAQIISSLIPVNGTSFFATGNVVNGPVTFNLDGTNSVQQITIPLAGAPVFTRV